MRDNKYVIAALVVAVISGLLVFQFLNHLNKRVSVVVAKTDIPRHARIDENMIEILSIHPSGMQFNTFEHTDGVLGKYALDPMYSGEQIVAFKISENERDSSFMGQITNGKRAIFVPFSLNQGLGGAVNKNDKVDIIYVAKESRIGASFAKTLLQSVPVLDVRSDSGQTYDSEERGSNLLGVIIEVNPVEVEKIAYCLEHGELYLAASPFDGTLTKTNGIYHENLFASE